jgi:multiple sugar transport system permease protein
VNALRTAPEMLWTRLASRVNGRLVLKRTHQESLIGWVLIAPWLIGFVWFQLFPILASFALSFTAYNLAKPPTFVGLDNFRSMFFHDMFFHDTNFWIGVRVTTLYALMTVPLSMVEAILVALLLNQRVPGIAFFRTAFYVPAMTSTIGWMLLWTFLLGQNGGVNWALELVGIEGPAFLFSKQWALPSLALMHLFQVGSSMLVILAALQGVPQHLYEALEIDGGGEWAKFWHVTIPQISPAIFFNLVITIIANLQIWETAYVMTQGGPAKATHFFGLELYYRAFQYNRMGYASAMAWILLAAVLALTAVNFLASKYWVYYEAQ